MLDKRSDLSDAERKFKPARLAGDDAPPKSVVTDDEILTIAKEIGLSPARLAGQ